MHWGYGHYLIAAGGAALILVAQVFVRERSADAALRLSIAGALVALPMASMFVRVPMLQTVQPLVLVAAAGLAVWALFLLCDALHPRQENVKLPPTIEAVRNVRAGVTLGGRIGWAVIGLGLVAFAGRGYEDDYDYSYGGFGAEKVMAALGVVAAILGAHLIGKRGNAAVWTIERHPEWVVWIYPSQLTVVSQRYGTRSMHWRAIIGLTNKLLLVLPAGSDAGAAAMAAELATVLPDATVGHNPDLAAKFQANPESLRRGARS